MGGAAPEQLADGAVVAVGDPARRRRRPLHCVLEAFVGHGLPAGAPVESVEFDMRTTQPGGQRGGEGRLPGPAGADHHHTQRRASPGLDAGHALTATSV